MTKKTKEQKQLISHKIKKLKKWTVPVFSTCGLRVEYKNMYYYE